MTYAAVTRAVVVAFDGVFAATLDARHAVLVEALAAHGVATTGLPEPSRLAGRTFAECARDLVVHDETVVDLVAWGAGRGLEGRGAAGWTVDPGVLLVLRQHAQSGRRLVLRADSSRQVVERALSIAGVTDLFSLVRCSDDLPRDSAATALESSWTAIDRRLLTFGITTGQRLALEPDAAKAVAGRFARVLPDAPPIASPRFPE